jgi:hypothetical protein
VETAETLFTPVMIRNNVDGYEQVIRDRYKEPDWNYPVTRFIDAAGKDLIPRRDQLFSIGHMTHRAVKSLQAAERPVPDWLASLWDETSSEKVQMAAFAMY